MMSTDLGTDRIEGVSGDHGSPAVLEQLAYPYADADYVEAVVELAELSERHYLAAVAAGQVVNGFASSTNF